MDDISIRFAGSFDDPAIDPELWERVLQQGDTKSGILTWQSQRTWWQEHQQLGQLLLLVASRDGQARAIAPLFVASGMAMNLCPVNSLDVVGDISDPDLLDAILLATSRRIDGFAGIRFHFVPDRSRTGERLAAAAGRLGWQYFLEDELASPIIDLRGRPEAALACTRKKTVMRRENQLCREGVLSVHHFRGADEVLPQLDLFFEQHVERWEGTDTPSKFRADSHRDSFRRRTAQLAEAGILRFSRLDCKGRPIAFHRGSCYGGHYKYGRVTHAKDMSRFSPGAVLLRYVLLDAINEGAHTFDFGLGDEAYKSRYATDTIHHQTWGLYPSPTERDAGDR